MRRYEITPEALRSARGALGWTQTEAARAYGVDIRSWQRWEAGDREIPPVMGDWIRYRHVVQAELAALELGVSEAALVCDALNSWAAMEVGAYRVVWMEVADHVRLNQADQKWSVDGQRLVRRLQGLSPGGCAALVDAVERFWERVDEPTAEVLRDVGLTSEEPPPELPDFLREGPPLPGDEWKEG